MDTTPCFSAIFTSVLVCFHRQGSSAIEIGLKNKNGRVASPESVPIDLKNAVQFDNPYLVIIAGYK